MAKIGAAAAGAVGVLVLAVFVASLFTVGPGSVHVAFAEVLRPVVEATGEPRAVHMVLRMLTREGEDFTYVNLEGGELRPVELWLQGPLREGDPGRARIEKKDRIYCFDGTSSVLYFPGRRIAYRDSGFDSGFFWPAEWVRQIQSAPVEGVEVLAHEEKDGEGRLRLRAKGVSMKPLEPAFFDQFDRETEVVWDLATHRLKALRRWVDYKGERRLFTELASIDYQPAFDEGIFRLTLPDDVRWGGLSDRTVPADQIGLGPRDVAQKIFEASIHRDRPTLELYIGDPDLVDWFMTHDLEIVSLGEAFQAGNYRGWFVPYEVQVRWGGLFHSTKKHNLALRNDNPHERWQLDGGW